MNPKIRTTLCFGFCVSSQSSLNTEHEGYWNTRTSICINFYTCFPNVPSMVGNSWAGSRHRLVTRSPIRWCQHPPVFYAAINERRTRIPGSTRHVLGYSQAQFLACLPNIWGGAEKYWQVLTCDDKCWRVSTCQHFSAHFSKHMRHMKTYQQQLESYATVTGKNHGRGFSLQSVYLDNISVRRQFRDRMFDLCLTTKVPVPCVFEWEFGRVFECEWGRTYFRISEFPNLTLKLSSNNHPSSHQSPCCCLAFDAWKIVKM